MVGPLVGSLVGSLAGLLACMLAGEACATATETSGVFALTPDSNIADQLQDVLVEAPEPIVLNT